VEREGGPRPAWGSLTPRLSVSSVRPVCRENLVPDRDSIRVGVGLRFRPRDVAHRRVLARLGSETATTLVVDAASPGTRSAGSYTTSMPSASNRRLAVEEFVSRLRQALSSNMLDVRLFGSEARGEATSESDIDVLVVVQPDTDRVQFEDRIIDIAFDVNLDFGVYISPRVVTPGILNDPVWRETPFIKNVARESIPL
jgi:predicted nucleotidyltransferase